MKNFNSIEMAFDNIWRVVIDSILMFAGKPNLFFGLPLPCLVTLFLLKTGILLFGVGSKDFKKQ